MPRFPISSKEPCAQRHANDAAMKSSERLLSTACERLPLSHRRAPDANAAALRELQSARSPLKCRRMCFCGRPAVPMARADSHCTYSTVLSPTPPAAAWIMMADPARKAARASAVWAVLHETGKVHDCSKVSVLGLSAK
eukprot:136048-Prymnesium_polylepis.1